MDRLGSGSADSLSTSDEGSVADEGHDEAPLQAQFSVAAATDGACTTLLPDAAMLAPDRPTQQLAPQQPNDLDHSLCTTLLATDALTDGREGDSGAQLEHTRSHALTQMPSAYAGISSAGDERLDWTQGAFTSLLHSKVIAWSTTVQIRIAVGLSCRTLCSVRHDAHCQLCTLLCDSPSILLPDFVVVNDPGIVELVNFVQTLTRCCAC
jgi:hypothetical protein